MLSVPFPVITLLVLLFLLLIPFLSGKTFHTGTMYFLLSYIFLLSISTFRWELDSTLLRNIQSGLAILLPPMIWCFCVSMTWVERRFRWIYIFLPAVVSLCIRIFCPQSTDILIILLFSSYGCGLFRVAFHEEYQLILSKQGYSSGFTNIAFFAGCFLFISSLNDLIIVLDFNINGGKLASNIVIISQVILYPVIISIVICSLKSSKNMTNDVKTKSSLGILKYDQEDISSLFQRVEAQVLEKQIYLNPDLTLTILSKKTGIPARQLSSAINTIMCCNVSQWINGLRIERAKELLRSTTLPVTDIMLESGFMTKSNFNREFQRIVGITPTLFRRQKHDNSEMNSDIN